MPTKPLDAENEDQPSQDLDEHVRVLREFVRDADTVLAKTIERVGRARHEPPRPEPESDGVTRRLKELTDSVERVRREIDKHWSHLDRLDRSVAAVKRQ